MVLNRLVCRSRSSREKEESFHVRIVKEDWSETSQESSLVSLETVDDFFRDSRPSRKPHQMMKLVPASSKDLGAAHSGMDVHGCLDTTCKNCKPQDILFLPHNPSNIDKLKSTMWTICHQESQARVPTCVPVDQVEHHFDMVSFRCTCGHTACGYFYEI